MFSKLDTFSKSMHKGYNYLQIHDSLQRKHIFRIPKLYFLSHIRIYHQLIIFLLHNFHKE